MAKLSTHVLDTANGIPAINMYIRLYGMYPTGKTLVLSATTNREGRADISSTENNTIEKGIYEMHFFVAEYFNRKSKKTTLLPFLDIVPVRFSISDNKRNYHIPLLISQWSYSTYLGSQKIQHS